jgi:hypothetical protein
MRRRGPERIGHPVLAQRVPRPRKRQEGRADNRLRKLVDAKKTFALAVYWPGNALDSDKNAAAVTKKVVAAAVYGKFSATANNWLIEDETSTSYPWLLVYVEGKRVHSRALNESTDSVAMDLVAAFEGKFDEL